VTGLADVDVAVHQPGYEHLVGVQVEGVPPGQRAGVQRLDGRNRSAKNADRQRPFPLRRVTGDGAGSADEQVRRHSHDLDIKL